MNMYDDMDCLILGLIEVFSYIWCDVVFVNFFGIVVFFEEVNVDFMVCWFEFDSLYIYGGEGSYFCLDVVINWKFVVENYCESYYLFWVYLSFNSYFCFEDYYNIEESGKYLG